jgi:FkbM family methyltransferase
MAPVAGGTPPGEAAETTIFRLMSTDRALARLARRGVEVGTVIDVGASNGMWSAVCEKHYPRANYLLVEAQETHRPALEEYCRRRPQAAFVLAAAGPRLGEIWFDDSDPFGGLASERQTASMRRKVPVTTLDHEIATRKLAGPHLVKLDVHGFEVPILDGAVETLRHASLVVIECYLFRVAEGCLLFDEMVARMRSLGFGVLDASEPLWRARDGCLWQMDFFFAPLTRPEFASNTWS